MEKPCVFYSTDKVSARSLILKKAQEKNSEIMRGKTVEEHRDFLERLAEVRIIPSEVIVKPETINEVSCEWIYLDSASADRVIFYLHGGSWMLGNIRTARPVAALFAEINDCKILAVDYRLSPEHPFPAAHNDALAVYKALLDRGIGSDKIMFLGDSAGGNLVLGLVQRLIDDGLPLPAAVGCASPVADLTENGVLEKNKPDLLYTKYLGEEHSIISLYLAGKDPSHPYVSPINAELSKYPPMLIHVGGDEDLTEDNVIFAQKASSQGAKILCKVWNGMYHDFTTVGPTLKESKLSIYEISAFFRKHWLQTSEKA